MTAQESRPTPAPRVTPAVGAAAAVPTTSARRDRLEAIRDDALDLAERLGRDMRAVSEARESSNVDDEHDPEGATIAYERSQLDAIRRSALVRAHEPRPEGSAHAWTTQRRAAGRISSRPAGIASPQTSHRP